MVSEAKKVLAISSCGGHWTQLKRLLPALDGCKIVFVTEHARYRTDVGSEKFYFLNAAIRWDKIGLLRQAGKIFWIVIKERPDYVISTGTACGFFAFCFAKLLLGSRTIWVDSIANTESLSLSGRLAGRLADLWLTQWPHLAKEGGPYYYGSTL
ncbi:MAG: UDP-N-acetylglucosamine--LPS N-acetylglucosamine transferase [Candidatus Omnitrophica bacterium]|nr:UDP-N-acetylglucosamine--LPS N-acetylglucosamine transferase [Candidatus Omnitrophota bacterium]